MLRIWETETFSQVAETTGWEHTPKAAPNERQEREQIT